MLKRIIAVVMLFALPGLAAQAAPGSQIDHEDASVLQAVLQSQCQSKDGYVLLSSKPAVPRESDDMGDADESGAFYDLKRRSGSSTVLPKDLSCNGVKLRDGEEIHRFFVGSKEQIGKASLEAAWKKLYESFPGSTGWMSVSLPGYAPSGDIAIVYVALYCGSLCGQGTYVYLHRNDGHWKVLVRFPIWVS